MSTFLKVSLVILVILIIALIVLYFLGKRLQKRQAAQQEQMEAAKQTVTMLIIDKKMMRIIKPFLHGQASLSWSQALDPGIIM